METAFSSSLNTAVLSVARQLAGEADDYDPLMELIGDARFVLLGEATHGTHEFYRERAQITQRLIAEKDFTAVAVEADWPDAWRVNRYVRHQSGDTGAIEALEGFRRFPTWMWRNTDVVDFIDWLRDFNGASISGANGVGFYGLDLYSMFTSIEEVLRYLDKTDPAAARRARTRYACFDQFREDSQFYGYAASSGLSESCEDEVVAQLHELLSRANADQRDDGRDIGDAYFHAQQNARLVKNAEEYYRAMFRGQVRSWNLRDRHMAETLDSLAQYLTHMGGKPAKIVVWEHNSHIGDARATEVGSLGQWNVGQIARELYGNETRLIGFTTYQGTVTAASDWDAPAERKRVLPALPGSYEAAFHDTGMARFLLPLRTPSPAAQALLERRLERAIGVIYAPETERESHYFHAQLPRQFDAVLHFDETRAVVPLELGSEWRTGEAPETFPVGV